MNLVGSVKDKDVIIVDDIIDTAVIKILKLLRVHFVKLPKCSSKWAQKESLPSLPTASLVETL